MIKGLFKLILLILPVTLVAFACAASPTAGDLLIKDLDILTANFGIDASEFLSGLDDLTDAGRAHELVSGPAAQVGLIAVASAPGGVPAQQAALPDVSAVASQAYTVQPGDTLTGIATAYGTDVGVVLALNAGAYPVLVENPRALQIGWTLRVPAKRNGVAVETSGSAPAAQSGGGAAPATLAAAPAPAASGGLTVEAVEQAIIDQINAERVAAGLHALVRDETLMQLARARSADMVARGYFGHYDPVTGERLNPCYCGENAAGRWNLSSALSTTMSDWMNSPGHRENILRPNNVAVGVGVAPGKPYTIVTALFALG